MSKLRTLLLLAVGLFALVPAAFAAPWVVDKATGEVVINMKGATLVSLGPDREIDSGATITTGSSGRVLLVRGKETMIVGPNSLITVPGDTASGFTRIVQRAGTVEFDVEHKNVKHFEVDTPFLAALVKGTHFVVMVGPNAAQVSVSRGRVGVTDSRRGGSVDILPGQTAQVSTTASLSVTGEVDNTKVDAQTNAAASFDATLDSTVASVGGAVSGVTTTVSGTVSGVTNTVGTVTSTVTGTVSGVTNTVSGVTNAVSGLLGGNSNNGNGNGNGNSQH